MTKENRFNLLIVDDQIANLKILVNILNAYNYKVRKATNGRTAIDSAQIESPDLILLDILMPELNGYEVCKILKSDEKTKDIPIIFISALSEVFDKVKAFELGAVDYITKPFQQKEVLARIQNQLTIQYQKKLLKKDRELISNILNNSLDGIAALEAIRDHNTKKIKDFRILVVNRVLAKIFHYKSEDLIKNVDFITLINNLEANLMSSLIKVVETGINFKRDISYSSKNKEKWYNFSAVKLNDGLTITIRDITTRKKVELELNRLATIDGLTGIANRRTFDQKILQEWQQSQQEKTPLSVILCDIDYFKFYNDFYGHQAGDDCLKIVAKTIENSIKKSSNLVARYGGEEFVIILPNTNQEEAKKLAENIKKEIFLQGIPHQKSKVSDLISLSLGIATMIPIENSSPDILINMADQALYQAKKQGRNQYYIYC